jgi:hypothetical protein
VIVARRRRILLAAAAIGLAVIALVGGVSFFGGARSDHGVFTATGPMTAIRSAHTATLLADGRVLVAGGQEVGTSATGVLRSAELYDPSTGRFSPTGQMTSARAGQTAVLLADGRVLVFGGFGRSSAELYDPATGKFTQTGSMSFARENFTATRLDDGRVLVAGGDDFASGGALSASAELFDPATGKFSSTGSMSRVRARHAAALLADGRVLIAGGNTDNGQTPTAELYDPKTGKFTRTGSMMAHHASATATRLGDGRVLIAGGWADDGGPAVATAELYDPATATFSLTGSMKVRRAAPTAALLHDGRVLIAGGVSGGSFDAGPLASAELFDPGTGTFTATGSLPLAAEGNAATALADGRILITGGDNGHTSLNAAELYRP